MNKRGFTLIELMIVILIIGILSAVGIPRYQTFMMEARQKSCASQLKSIDQAVSVWETKNVSFNVADAGYLRFSPQDGRILNADYRKPNPGYGSNIAGYPGLVPRGMDIADIVKDGRTFACPELTRRYKDQRNIPANWYLTYYFWKVCRNWGGWHDFVPARIGRAAVCRAFGYNRSDGLSVVGNGTAQNGVNGVAPSPSFSYQSGGPDRTRNTLHLEWQSKM